MCLFICELTTGVCGACVLREKKGRIQTILSHFRSVCFPGVAPDAFKISRKKQKREGKGDGEVEEERGASDLRRSQRKPKLAGTLYHVSGKHTLLI